MTTTIRVDTSGTPAAVTINEPLDSSSPFDKVAGERTMHTFIPADSMREFHIADNASISVIELPKDFVSLDGPGDPLAASDTVTYLGLGEHGVMNFDRRTGWIEDMQMDGRVSLRGGSAPIVATERGAEGAKIEPGDQIILTMSGAPQVRKA